MSTARQIPRDVSLERRQRRWREQTAPSGRRRRRRPARRRDWHSSCTRSRRSCRSRRVTCPEARQNERSITSSPTYLLTVFQAITFRVKFFKRAVLQGATRSLDTAPNRVAYVITTALLHMDTFVNESEWFCKASSYFPRQWRHGITWG